jgi:F-type H+-transporting ATPase subunit epsilon
VADANAIHVEVVTPDGEVYRDEVSMVVLPGVEGEMGVLPRHEPLVTLLRVGETRARRGDGTWSYIATGMGYAQVLFDTVFVVVDHGELAGAIDVARAEAALARAQELIKTQSDPGARAEADFYRAEQALRRAENRLAVARRRAIK